MSWATEQQVLDLTGSEVTDEQIAQAQGVIDLYAGVTEDVEDLSDRDTRLLRVATCYQAVWMAQQVDVFSRTEVKQVDQDGVRVTPADADSLILAPLARRALRGLSWNRANRTTHVLRAGERRYRTLEDYRDAWLRDGTTDRWEAM